MKLTRLLFALAAAAALSSPAWAGPAHVLASRVIEPTSVSAKYAVSKDLDAQTRKALAEALNKAGLVTVPVNSPHDYIVTVQERASALCTAACSSLVGHDVAPLSDNYRHVAIVSAQPNTGARSIRGTPVAWYTYLQSDGLSSRTDDYLPALLHFGARAYGRDTAPEAPPKLSR